MKTLFLDRDGVINEQIIDGYVMSIDQFVFKDGVFEALRLLRTQVDKLILVTNQQCVGKGLCSMDCINEIHEWMQKQLRQQGCAFDGIYCCPHLASDHCACRKPRIGMIEQALRDFPDIDMRQAMMLGDSLSDIQMAQNAGIFPVHVGAVRHPEFEQIQEITSIHYDSLLAFAQNEIKMSALNQ